MCVGENKKGLLPPSGEKPRTLVKQSIHWLKPVKMSKVYQTCDVIRKVLLPKETLDFYIYHIDFGLCDRSHD